MTVYMQEYLLMCGFTQKNVSKKFKNTYEYILNTGNKQYLDK